MISTLITTLEYIAQAALFAPLACFIGLIIKIVRGKGDDDTMILLILLTAALFIEYIGLNMWQELTL